MLLFLVTGPQDGGIRHRTKAKCPLEPDSQLQKKRKNITFVRFAYLNILYENEEIIGFYRAAGPYEHVMELQGRYH